MGFVRLFILAIVLIVSSLLIGGRYEVAAVSRSDDYGIVYVVDRFTGQTFYCLGVDCRTARWPLPAPAGAPQTPSPVQ